MYTFTYKVTYMHILYIMYIIYILIFISDACCCQALDTRSKEIGKLAFVFVFTCVNMQVFLTGISLLTVNCLRNT